MYHYAAALFFIIWAGADFQTGSDIQKNPAMAGSATLVNVGD